MINLDIKKLSFHDHTRPGQPSVTFVTCVEAGPLELQVVRLAGSLRRWGGRFRACPILAVCPRFGPPLGAQTLRAFSELGVTFCRTRPRNRYTWLGYINKPYAMLAAETMVQTEWLAWLDGDVLIIGEPEELLMSEDEDFAACAADKNIGSSGLDDPHEPYWRELCGTLGLKVEDMPWVVTGCEGIRIRLYWNSGVFIYRRSTGFARTWLSVCDSILDAQIISHASRSFFTDQIALSLAMIRAELRWRSLNYLNNFSLIYVTSRDRECDLKATRILHYHDAMWPSSWPEFMRILGSTRPDVRIWLEPQGPLRNPSSTVWKVLRKALGIVRSRRLSSYEAACRVV